ncbi:hypothetical protein JQM69_07700 [Faecalicatena contorta]|nr:hypothetical protein [Faecalicatena contorta]
MYECDKTQFSLIPGLVFAYWIYKEFIDVYKISKPLEEYAKPRVGLQTSDNNRFVRMWEEVDYTKIGFCIDSRECAEKSGFKWFPYNKGGGYQRWYSENFFLYSKYLCQLF